MSIWELALEESRRREAQSDSCYESTLLFTGSKNSSKTSIINRFLDKESELVKSTVALEYTFGRRSKAHSSDKDITHIWELGGGISMLKLLNNCIDADTLMNLSLVIVVDLSQPSSIWFTVENIIKFMLSAIEKCISSASDSKLKDHLRKNLKERLKAHKDANQMEPFPIPLVIVGAKYDLFMEKVDLELRRVTCRCLRFLAHYYNAGLFYFTTVKQKDLTAKLRTQLTCLAFNLEPEASVYQYDINLPLLIAAGNDSFESIGEAPVDQDDYNRMAAKTPLELWRYAFHYYFPEERKGMQTTMPGDPTIDPSDPHRYSEPLVDKARAAKDEELDKYRKASERRMRDLLQQAVGEGVQITWNRA